MGLITTSCCLLVFEDFDSRDERLNLGLRLGPLAGEPRLFDFGHAADAERVVHGLHNFFEAFDFALGRGRFRLRVRGWSTWPVVALRGRCCRVAVRRCW